jgi:hypothetical protein
MIVSACFTSVINHIHSNSIIISQLRKCYKPLCFKPLCWFKPLSGKFGFLCPIQALKDPANKKKAKAQEKLPVSLDP